MKEIYKIYQLLVWTLIIILSSCSQEEFSNLMNNGDLSNNESNSSEEGKDSFIISYSLGEENASRVSGAPHKSTIQSLHYYVYNEDGVLVKKRQIRGISKELTWPLTNNRTDMSWELRQDLQDTLSDHSKYRILFIANADPKLFDMVEAEGKKEYQQPIINDNNYSTAQLVLPQEAFKEDNMYYMWEGIIDRTNPTTPGETLKRNDIVLRRVVTRIDFERKISLTATDAEDEDEVLYQAVKEGLYKQWINNEGGMKVDEAAINRQMDKFEGLIKSEVVNVSLNKYPYQGKKGKAQEFINFLQTNRALITPVVKDLLIRRYVEEIKKNTTWINSSWKGCKLVKIQFKAGSQLTRMGFNRSVSHHSEYGDTRIFPVDVNGRFSMIGFGQPNSNDIESLYFYEQSGGTEKNVVSGVAFTNTLLQEKNKKYQVYCNPAGTKIECGDTKKDYSLKINLDAVFRDNPETQSQWDAFSKFSEPCNDPKFNFPFFEYLYNFVFIKGGKNQGFGTNFTDFIIPFSSSTSYGDKHNHTIPDLSTPDAPITLYPSWMIPE